MSSMVPTETYRLLVVEDDRELAGMVADFLESHGFLAQVEHDGLEAVRRIREEPFDAVILDIGLPNLDGIEVCRAVRPNFDGPILILTARGGEIDEVVALEVGADDYMSKPVRPRALLARLKVHLRRVDASLPHSDNDVLRIGELTINPSCREVTLDGQVIGLTTAEFDLLESLARQAGVVVPRAEIYEQLNGIRYDGLDRSIDLRVSRLRRKLGDDPQNPTMIKSVRGVGYILVARP
ncbi:response regulator transcription factor [Aureliella helgolandensis]|uniref:Transcriptional regulatory protein YycF n=1 Tax=Aureliella helgolandensis TaxID=2527968 RepID=A0A518G9X3_9BACT|nr:response regulator transcription factor [Aureliella helgolandensis]QDV25391.1 Transcriptional regulatory protein YycF [Aureliella helgolandensis]